MEELYRQVAARKYELETAIRLAERYMQEAPQGKLRAMKHAQGAHYYKITEPNDTIGEYIPLSEGKLIEDLANKSYAQQLLRSAQKELAAIDRILACKELGRAEKVYSELNKYRKPYVTPILISDEEYAARWAGETYKTNPYRPEEKTYETNRHEYVRSKSEMQIANIIDQLGYMYRYEAELRLADGSVKYPDYTILNPRKRKVKYLEHSGLIDDSGYRRDALQKFNEYCRNGIVLGRDLIVTYEAQGSPLNVSNIRRTIQEVMEM